MPPFWLRNAHLQTVWPTVFRRVNIAAPEKERILTPDDDFLDLDWYRGGNSRLLVLSHGLEGSSRRPYILGLARAARAAGWDVLAWNFRSCSGELNRQPRFYHSGAWEDLDLVVRHGLEQGYARVVLGGFSIGGNLTLVYLGQHAKHLPKELAGAVVFSVPCDLAGSAERLARPANRLYMRRFLRELGNKMRRKHARFPEVFNLDGLDEIRNFQEFDDRYTAPLHGFQNAGDYWRRCSSAGCIEPINLPALIINARDDPFLSERCYPKDAVDANPRVTLETPRHGGHLGFVSRPTDGVYWSEERALAFLEEIGRGSK